MGDVFIFLLIVGVSVYAGFSFCKITNADSFFSKEEIDSFTNEYEQKIANLERSLSKSKDRLRKEEETTLNLHKQIERLKEKVVIVEKEQEANLSLKALANFV